MVNNNLYDNPALYDALLPAGPHVSYYVDLARRQGGDVLELACGTGQLTVPIARAGFRTSGLDISTAMLNRGRQRGADANVSIEYVSGDMRNFDLGREFALIFIARNSLLHLSSTEEILATLATVRRHLAPNGIFAFDIFNPDVRILARPKERRFPIMEAQTESFGALCS